jgi:hypothetical protein
MFTDILSAVGLTAGAAVLVATLSFMLSGTVQGRLRAAVLLAAWFAVVVLLGAADALGQDHGTGPPGLGTAVILPVAALCLIMFRTEQTRHTMSAVPLAVLIAVHGVRVLGVIFLLLYAEQRLPAPFAPVAGWGDVLIGIVAVPLAWTVGRRADRHWGRAARLDGGAHRYPREAPGVCLEHARSARSDHCHYPRPRVLARSAPGVRNTSSRCDADNAPLAFDPGFHRADPRVAAHSDLPSAGSQAMTARRIADGQDIVARE